MRLLLLTTSYPLSPQSAAGVFVARLVRHLPHLVQTVVVTPASSLPINVEADTATIVPFRYAPQSMQILAQQPGGIPVALRRHKSAHLLLPGFLLSMLLSCARAGRRTDVMHANWAICGCIAGLVAKWSKTPVITTLRGDDVARAQRHWIDRTILSLCLRWSTRVVTVSEAIAKWVRQQFPQVASKVCVIENGVEDVFLSTPPERAHAASTRVRLIAVGSLIERKGVDQLLAAVQCLPQPRHVMLTIIGDGPERQRLVELTESLGIRDSVDFLGELPPIQILQQLARAHIFVSASHSEGRPNAILEAMAAALPVIASNIEGIDELVEPERTGFLFPPGAVKQLAARMETLINDDALRERMGLAGRAAIERRHLTWHATAKRYYELYQEIIRERQTCVG